MGTGTYIHEISTFQSDSMSRQKHKVERLLIKNQVDVIENEAVVNGDRISQDSVGMHLPVKFYIRFLVSK